MADIFAIGFLENLKVFFTAVLMYALIFAVLKMVKPLGDDSKINSVIALVAAIITSFSGVVTYAVAYAINWFAIIIFVIFLFMILIMFLGVTSGDIAAAAKGKVKLFLIIFLLLFSVIIFKSFFALNNSFDSNDPMDDPYGIDPSFNTGVDDITNKEISDDFWDKIIGFFDIDPDILSAAIFLIGLGIFVMVLGKN